MIGPSVYILTALALYCIGIYCLLSKRNLIRLLLGLGISANGANLSFIALSTAKVEGLVDPLPHAFVITAIVIDGCVIAVGLALVIAIYRIYRTLDADELRRLRW